MPRATSFASGVNTRSVMPFNGVATVWEPNELYPAKGLYISDVLRSAGGTLVLDQRSPTYDGDFATLDTEGFSVSDGFGKRDAVSAIDDVDPSGWNPELEDTVVRSEILNADLERRERRPERDERRINTLGIVRIRFDQDVEVLGRTRMAMEGDGVTTKHDEAGSGVVELHEEIAKIVKQLDHARIRGTKRT